MKTTHWISMILAAACLTLPACSKSKPPPTVEVAGVKLDVPQFQQAFAGNAQSQAAVLKISLNIRYTQYANALSDLQVLANDPGLNDQQKKLAADLTAQLQQLVAKAAAP